MRLRILVVTAALAACGCVAQAARDSAPSPSADAVAAVAPALAGSNWRFVEVEGVAVPKGVDASLRLRAGRVSGKAGCNAYAASWNPGAGGRASFGAPRSTKMACMTPAGVMQVEHAVFLALARTAAIRQEGDRLVLLDLEGKPVARLMRETAEQ